MKPTGSPASAKTRADSIPSLSCASGAMQQTSRESGGRWRRVCVVAGDDPGHLDGVRGGLLAHHRLGLDVLDGVVEGGIQLVQRGSRREILCADDRPVEADRGQVVGNARHFGDVLLAGGAALAGRKIDRFHAAAIGGAVQRLPVQVEVVGRRARPHGVEARRMRHGLQHHVGRKAHDLALEVHLRPMLGVDLQRLFRGAMHTDLLQDLQRGD